MLVGGFSTSGNGGVSAQEKKRDRGFRSLFFVEEPFERGGLFDRESVVLDELPKVIISRSSKRGT